MGQIEQLLHIDLWPGQAVKIENAPVQITGASSRGISGYYNLDCGQVEWVRNCDAHKKKVGVEVLYNSVHRKFNQLETRCGRENQHPERLGPQAPSWAAQENGKETRLWPVEWGSICCSSVWSPTPSHTQPFQIKWEVYFSKDLCRSSLLRRHYDYVLCVCIVGHGYTTQFDI